MGCRAARLYGQRLSAGVRALNMVGSASLSLCLLAYKQSAAVADRLASL